MTQRKTSVAWVRERTILTKRPLFVDEVSADCCGERVPRGQRDIPTTVISVFYTGATTFCSK
jgi:hypothetical protein